MPDGLVVGAAAAAGVGLSAYALLGGADFGGGVWDAVAGRGDRADRRREAVSHAMGPVWEANHVWLIFVIVVLFTAFPPVFAALSVALYVPLSLALLGIVMRGAAFGFRAHASGAAGAERAWGVVFSASSVVTPFIFGACAGALASGDVRAGEGAETETLALADWLGPFPLVCGLLAVAICAYLAAVYLTVETRDELQEDFRRRALAAAAAVALLGAAGLPLARSQAPAVADDLLGGAATPLVVLAAAAATASAWLVARRRFGVARVAAAAFVLAVLWGWGLAQWPLAIPPELGFEEAAAPDATLRVFLVVLAAGSVVLVPSLWLLFSVFKGDNPAEGEPGHAPR